MPIEATRLGYVPLNTRSANTIEMAEHGLIHAANHDFFDALLDVVELLRIEALIRECHPIHDKLAEMAEFIKAGHCQDFVPSVCLKDF